MNIFFVVILGIGVLFVVLSLRSKKEESTTARNNKENPDSGIAATTTKKLSTNDAREWLDDFLVKQQSDSDKK